MINNLNILFPEIFLSLSILSTLMLGVLLIYQKLILLMLMILVIE